MLVTAEVKTDSAMSSNFLNTLYIIIFVISELDIGSVNPKDKLHIPRQYNIRTDLSICYFSKSNGAL